MYFNHILKLLAHNWSQKTFLKHRPSKVWELLSCISHLAQTKITPRFFSHDTLKRLAMSCVYKNIICTFFKIIFASAESRCMPLLSRGHVLPSVFNNFRKCIRFLSCCECEYVFQDFSRRVLLKIWSVGRYIRDGLHNRRWFQCSSNCTHCDVWSFEIFCHCK